jgi:hypothetical protein
MTILDEAVIDLKAKHKTNGVKIRRLDERQRDGSKQFKAGLRAAAESILAEAEKAAMKMWKENPDMKTEYKTRKEFMENELRDFTEELLEDFVAQLDDEVDVVLTHKHGV